MPEISVIVPVYKTEAYLHRCVDSILSQTFTDFELILVDDGSPDNCGTICDEYAKQNQRIRVFHQNNRGQAAARNLALDWIFENSDSKYVSFVDSDDWVHPRYLELLYKANAYYGVNISQCLHIETDGLNKTIPIEDKMILITPEEEYISWYSAYFWGKMFLTDILKNIRFPEGQIYEDVAIWYKVLFKEEKIALVNEILYYYYINPDGTVQSDWMPAKLAQVRAWDAQIAFFDDIGNKDLIDCASMHYLQILVQHLRNITKSKAITWLEKKRYKSLIWRKLLQATRKYRNTPYYITHKYYVLNNLFPRIMWIYWTVYGVTRKINKTLKRGQHE